MSSEQPQHGRTAELQAVLAQTTWRVRPERFALVRLHPREQMLALQLAGNTTSPFFQYILEPEALTLVLRSEDWREIRPAFPQARVQQPYRLISFPLDLPDTLTGFLATITTALAEAGVPLLAICSYSRDHLLVREEHLSTATAALDALLAGAIKDKDAG